MRKKFLSNIMKVKEKDAVEAVKVEDHKYQKEMRRLRNVLLLTQNEIKTRFYNFKREKAEREWKATKEKFEKKQQHLIKKHKCRKIVDDTVEGIKVSDKALGETKHKTKPVVLNIDSDTISENVKQALSLHPKFATPVPINLKVLSVYHKPGKSCLTYFCLYY